MAEIVIPFPFGDLPIKPELTGKIKVTEDVQQTLATLLGWDGSSRRLVKTSMSGVMQTTTSQVRGILTETAGEANQVKTFADIPTTEIMIMAHPSNTFMVWVDIGAVPTAATSWPLDKKDTLIISLDNLNKLQILIAATGEKAIILYTR